MRDTVAASKASEGKALNSETSTESSWAQCLDGIKWIPQSFGSQNDKKKLGKYADNISKIVDT